MSFPDDPSGAGTPPGQPVPPSSPADVDEGVPSSPLGEAPPAGRPVSDFDHPVGDLTDLEHGRIPSAEIESEPALPDSAVPDTVPVSEYPSGVAVDFEHGPGPLPGSEFEHPAGADPWWTSQGAAESSDAVEAPAELVTTSTGYEPQLSAQTPAAGAPPKPPRPPDPPAGGGDEEEGMAQMSFLEHLEELRKRLLMAVGGVGVAFFLSLIFSDELWQIVFAPAGKALAALNVNPPELIQIAPMDAFQIMWMKLPILAAVFLSSPWILYQVWAFIAPGLYRRERRYAVPFVLFSAGLFILGGLFAYFVAFRFGLEFLLGLGIGKGVHPAISMNEYYDLFVDVMLGVGIIFEIPVLLFLLTLIRVASPRFLVQHSRYAILIIVILAAVITPTGDVFNLALFSTPMIILFYVGIFASWLLVLKRENRRFPWGKFLKILGIVLAVLLLISWLAARYYGYHIEFRWPFLFK
jgi:sec-independent protein translocase protein TatC